MLTQISISQVEQPRVRKTTVASEVVDVAGSQLPFSQICNPDQGLAETVNVQNTMRIEQVNF